MKRAIKAVLWPMKRYIKIMADNDERLFRGNYNIPFWM